MRPNRAVTVSLVPLVLSVALAIASGASAQSLRIEPDVCPGFDAERDGFLLDDLHGQLIRSSSGTVTYVCTGQMPDEAVLPARPLVWNYDNTNGTPCDLWLYDSPDHEEASRFGATNDWEMRVSPSGRVIIRCHGYVDD